MQPSLDGSCCLSGKVTFSQRPTLDGRKNMFVLIICVHFRAMATHKSEAVEPTDELGREWLDIEAKRNCRQKKLFFHLNQPSNGQKLCSETNRWFQYQFKNCSILSCGQAHHQPEYLRRGLGSLPCNVEGEQNNIQSSASIIYMVLS